MNNSENETDNEEKLPEWKAIYFTSDIQNFSDYVLVPNHKTGKDSFNRAK